MGTRRTAAWVAGVAACAAGVVLAAQAVATPAGGPEPPALTGYVALGDSYASGEGAGLYAPATADADNSCHRSLRAYPVVVAAAQHPGPLSFRACSGAETADLFAANHDGNRDLAGAVEPPQLSALRPTTKVVTLTIGGNDLGFAPVLASCVKVTTWHVDLVDGGCASDMSALQGVRKRLRALAGTDTATSPDGNPIRSIPSVLAAIRAAAPRAEIVVIGYPRLFAGDHACTLGSVREKLPLFGTVTATATVGKEDAGFVNEVTRAYDAVLEDAVGAVPGPARYVDPDPEFAGHRLCDVGESWIHGITGSGSVTGDQHLDVGALHPTADGITAYARALGTL